MKTVIFDLDGTLADTSGDLIAAANACFERLGHNLVLDVETDGRVAMMGGGRAMLRLGFERLQQEKVDDQIEELYPLLLDCYAQNIDTHTMLYDGTVQALEVISGQGYGIGVCTNKPDFLAEDLLQKLGIRGHFGCMVGANTLPVRKPDPAPLIEAISRLGGVVERSILVGDSPTDRETARAAGAKSLLVTFGPIGHEVADLTPDAILHHYNDLSATVADLIGTPE